MDANECFIALLEAFEDMTERKTRLEAQMAELHRALSSAQDDVASLKRENASLAKMERFVERDDIRPLYNEFLFPKPTPDDDEPF